MAKSGSTSTGDAIRRRELFVRSCKLMLDLPIGASSPLRVNDLGRQWEGLPTDFFESVERLHGAHRVFAELDAIHPETADQGNADFKILREVCTALVVQGMSKILDDALADGSFMESIDFQRTRFEFKQRVSWWAQTHVSRLAKKFLELVDTVPSPVHSEYRQRPKATAALEVAAAQMDALATTLDRLNELFDSDDYAAFLDMTERDQAKKSARIARNVSLSMRTMCWPLKMGIPNSALVDLINEAISLRRTLIMGDPLATFLLSQFDSHIANGEVSFIRLLGLAPELRPQAGAELLMYTLLWTPSFADYAHEIESTLLKPVDAAWIRVMSLITNKVSFAAVDTSSATNTETQAGGGLATAFKKPSDLTPDVLREIRRLWTIAEVRTKEVHSAATKDAMEKFNERAAEMAQYGSIDAIRMRELDSAANERLRREELKMLSETNGGELTEEAKARYRMEETYQRSHVILLHGKKKDELQRAKASLENELAMVRSVEQQLEVSKMKMHETLELLHNNTNNTAKTDFNQVTPQALFELKNAFGSSISKVIDQVTSKPQPEPPTGGTGRRSGSKTKGQIVPSTDHDYVTVQFRRYHKEPQLGVNAVRFRILGGDLTFKNVKEMACKYFRQPNPDMFELYNPIEDGVWIEYAEVATQLENRPNRQSLLVLRRKRKVRQNVIGGSPETTDVRTAPISSLSLKQLKEREQLIFEEKRTQSIQIVKELVLHRGSRPSHNQRLLSLLMHLFLLGAYTAYSYATYGSHSDDATFMRQAALYTIENVPRGADQVNSLKDVYHAPVDQVAIWLGTTFANNILRTSLYSGFESNTSGADPPTFSSTFDENVAYTGIRLTQVRSRPTNCTLINGSPFLVDGVECFGDEIDRSDYDPNWTTYTGNRSIAGFTYTGGEDAIGITVTSEGLGNPDYGPDGYTRHIYRAIDFKPTMEELLVNNWLDGHTRALILTANLYNRALKQFATLELLFEFRRTGYLRTTVRFKPLPNANEASGLFDALRYSVLAVYICSLVIAVQKLRFHAAYHSRSVLYSAIRSTSWNAAIVTALMVTEVISRAILDHELLNLRETSSEGIAFLTANREFYTSLNSTQLDAAIAETPVLRDFVRADYRLAAARYLLARSFTGTALFFLCLDSSVAFLQYSSTFYLFAYYLFNAGSSALVAVLMALFSYLFGLSIIAYALVGPNSPEFATRFKAFVSTFTITVGPTRFQEMNNPFELTNFSPDADGSKQDLSSFPLLILLEVTMMIFIWSLFVSIFMEAFTNSTARIREEKRLHQAVAKLGVMRPPRDTVTRTVRGLVSESIAVVQDVFNLTYGFLARAKEYERVHLLNFYLHKSTSSDQQVIDLPSPQYMKTMARFKRALQRMQLRMSDAEQVVLLNHNFTNADFKVELKRKLRSFGLIDDEPDASETPVMRLYDDMSDDEGSMDWAPTEQKLSKQSFSDDSKKPKFISEILDDDIETGGSSASSKQNSNHEGELIGSAQEDQQFPSMSSGWAGKSLRAATRFLWLEAAGGLLPRSAPGKSNLARPRAPADEMLPDETYTEAGAHSTIASPQCVKQSLIQQKATKSESPAWVGSATGPTDMHVTSRYLPLVDNAPVVQPEQVRSSLQWRLPDDQDGDTRGGKEMTLARLMKRLGERQGQNGSGRM